MAAQCHAHHSKIAANASRIPAAPQSTIRVVIDYLENTIDRLGKLDSITPSLSYASEEEHVDARNHIICALVILILLIILIKINKGDDDHH